MANNGMPGFAGTGTVPGAAIGFIIVIGILVGLVLLIAEWKIFTKAGEEGWKSIVPLYGSYVRYALTWNVKFFWLIVVLAFVGRLMYALGGRDSSLVIISMVLSRVTMIIELISMNKLAKSFGKGFGFALGLMILRPIFFVILGFGSARYIGNTTE